MATVGWPGLSPEQKAESLAALATSSHVCGALRPVIPSVKFGRRERLESARLCKNSERNELSATTTPEKALQATQLGSGGVLRRPKTRRHRVFCTPSTDNRHLTLPAETPILRFV